MTANGIQSLSVDGSFRPQASVADNRIAAASKTRRLTRVSGGRSFRATPLKKNEPPQSTDSTMSNTQSRASIRVSVVGIQSASSQAGRLSVIAVCEDTRFPTARPDSGPGEDAEEETVALAAMPDAARETMRYLAWPLLGRDSSSIIFASSSSGAYALALS